MNEVKSLGQVAFEAYCTAVGGTAYDGKPIPGWDELSGDRQTVQGGWEAAAQAVREHTQMMAALDRGIAMGAVRGAAVTMKPSRWQPVAPGMWTAPLGELEPMPGGQGEPPTGETVPVDVEPDRND